MSEHFWPQVLIPVSSQFELLDASAISGESPLTGFVHTRALPGERTRVTLRFKQERLRNKALLQALIARMRGSADRLWLHDHTYVIEGGWADIGATYAELVASPTFALGTSGFTVGTNFTAVVSEQVYRATRILNDAGNSGVVRLTTNATVIPYYPYVARIMVEAGRGAYDALVIRAGTSAFTSEYESSVAAEAGMLSLAFTPYNNTAHVGLVQNAGFSVAGDYLSILYFSLARCALVDNGVNLLPYSDDFSNAAWTKNNATAGTSAFTSPDGTLTTVPTLKEDTTAAATHYFEDSVTVSAAAMDYCFTLAVKASNRTWVRIMMLESVGGDNVSMFVNLSTGVADAAAASGSGFARERGFVTDMGNGWYQCSILRKTSAGTTLTARIYAGEGSGDNTFTGLDQTSLRLFRATLAQAGSPVRLSQTTGTASTSGTDQAQGGGLYSRGWPISTSDILKIGTRVQIEGQYYYVTDPVHSDAGGRAFLNICPAIRSIPADGTPIIIVNPMAKLRMENPQNGWSTNPPGFIADAELTLSEAA